MNTTTTPNLDAAISNTVLQPRRERTDADILHDAIERGRSSAANVLRYVQENVPQDRLAKARTLGFEPGTSGLDLIVGERREPLTRYAIGQASERVGFPGGYANDVMERKGTLGQKVVGDALSTLWRAESDDRRVLLRSVQGRTHAVLSDAFRRLDCRPLVDAFGTSAAKYGAVPVEGVVTDTRIAIKAVLPRIFTLSTGAWNDSIALGIVLRNSDFGAARFSLATYLLRVRCMNGAIGEQLFAQTHVGGRLDEGDFFSERTVKLDAAAMVSATADYVKALLSPEGVERTVSHLQYAISQKLDVDTVLPTLKKSLTKEEMKGVIAALQSVDEYEMPLGPPTPYKMSNALSWVAGNTEDGDRALELQRLAGNFLKPAPLAVAA